MPVAINFIKIAHVFKFCLNVSARNRRSRAPYRWRIAVLSDSGPACRENKLVSAADSKTRTPTNQHISWNAERRWLESRLENAYSTIRFRWLGTSQVQRSVTHQTYRTMALNALFGLIVANCYIFSLLYRMGNFVTNYQKRKFVKKKSGSNISSIIWWMKSYEQRSWRISTWSHAVEGIPEPPPKIGTTNRVEIRYPWNVAPLSRWSSLVLSHTISLSLVVHLREIPLSPSPNSRDSISTKIYLSSKSLACEVASRDNYHIDKSLSCKTVAFSSPP